MLPIYEEYTQRVSLFLELFSQELLLSPGFIQDSRRGREQLFFPRYN